MLGESCNFVGEEVGGGRDEDSTAIVGKNAATAVFAGATSCVPNDWPYGRLDTELSVGMAPAYPPAPPTSFDRQRIDNAMTVDGIGSPGSVEELDYRFGEERCGWERIVRDLEEEVRRLRCKGQEDEGRHEDGSKIDLRGDVVINRVRGGE